MKNSANLSIVVLALIFSGSAHCSTNRPAIKADMCFDSTSRNLWVDSGFAVKSTTNNNANAICLITKTCAPKMTQAIGELHSGIKTKLSPVYISIDSIGAISDVQSGSPNATNSKIDSLLFYALKQNTANDSFRNGQFKTAIAFDSTGRFDRFLSFEWASKNANISSPKFMRELDSIANFGTRKPEELQESLKRFENDLQNMYSNYWESGKRITGYIVLVFAIDSDGNVVQVKIRKSTLDCHKFDTDAMLLMSKLKFPRISFGNFWALKKFILSE